MYSWAFAIKIWNPREMLYMKSLFVVKIHVNKEDMTEIDIEISFRNILTLSSREI